MHFLSINELIGVLRDLLDKRLSAVGRVAAGAAYVKLLRAVLADLEALPAALRGLPRAELLRLLDHDHDTYVRIMNLMRQALALWPAASPEMTTAAVLLASDYAVATDARLPYLEEARAATARGAKLEGHRPVFDAIPTPDGKTLTALIEGYAKAGRALGDNLSGRADDLTARGDASAAAALRGRAIGLLGDLRTAIRREQEADPTLPATLEADVFGFIDVASRMAMARAPGAPSAPPIAPAGGSSLPA